MKWMDIFEQVKDDNPPHFEIKPREWSNNQWIVNAYSNNKLIGYATFKRASNDYIKGPSVFRIGYYTVFDNWTKKGIASEMIAFFEQSLNAIVIPSGVFGAKGKLTDSGFHAAKNRLMKTKPSWLPDDWIKQFDNASRE